MDNAFPNGVAMSPDEKTLYVSSIAAAKPRILAFALGADGMPTASRVLVDALLRQRPDALGSPDGMVIDEHGNFFATGSGGMLVVSQEDELLGVISAGRAITNAKFDEDG